MASSATLYKAHINIADMDRHYYADHHLTIACHPSENETRMMVRVLAFMLNADERLQFGKGLSNQEEPSLSSKDDIDHIHLWIDLGQPDEKRIRHACQRADKVIIYTYQPNNAIPWWKQIQGKLNRFDNLTLWHLDQATVEQLSSMAKRSMKLQCTIDDGEVWISDDETQLRVQLNSEPVYSQPS